ncbi:MAG: hypothetical protein ACE5IJ_06380 [Thermoplasmata archaeon]
MIRTDFFGYRTRSEFVVETVREKLTRSYDLRGVVNVLRDYVENLNREAGEVGEASPH